MQLNLILKNQKTVLPIAYRYFVQSMIYNAVETNPGFSRFLHDNGYINEDKKFKLFTFSPLNGNYSINNKTITFSDTISLEIRSFEPAIIQRLIYSLQKGNKINIGQNILTIDKCTLRNQTIYKPQIDIRTVSPIVAYYTPDNTNRVYFSPEDINFNQLIVNNAKRKWISAGKNENDFELTFKRIDEIPIRKEVTNYKGSYITAWHGGFSLNGNPEVLDFLYNTGLGSKNSQGFGVFDLIK